MSDFADIFASSLEEREKQIKETLEPGFTGQISEELEQRFNKRFYSRETSEISEYFRVVACDAGRNEIEFRNSINFYVARAAAVDNSGDAARKIDLGALRPYRDRDYEKFMRRASEKVEIEAVLEKLEEEDLEEETYVIIDGTLLTRLLVTPKELELSDREDIAAEVIESFQKLLEMERKHEKLTLVGLSKDSNSGILYTRLMEDMIDDKIRELEEKTSLKKEDLNNLEKEFRKVRYAPGDVRDVIDNLEEQDELEEIRELVQWYRVRYSDTEMLEEFFTEEGYTQPLQVGKIKQKFFSALEDFQEDPGEFLEQEFPNSVERHKEIRQNIEKLFSSPGIVSFYWKPEDDSPLRVDLLSSEFEEGRNLKQVMAEGSGSSFLEANGKVQDILELIKTGYAGEEMHNVWISQADTIAGLPRKEIENVYKPLLEQKLGTNLRKYMRRRDKRV